MGGSRIAGGVSVGGAPDSRVASSGDEFAPKKESVAGSCSPFTLGTGLSGRDSDGAGLLDMLVPPKGLGWVRTVSGYVVDDLWDILRILVSQQCESASVRLRMVRVRRICLLSPSPGTPSRRATSTGWGVSALVIGESLLVCWSRSENGGMAVIEWPRERGQRLAWTAFSASPGARSHTGVLRSAEAPQRCC